MITIPGVASDMIAENIHPANPTHPGMVIKDEIDFLQISIDKLSEISGIAQNDLDDLLNCKRNISMEEALLIEATLDLSADMLINMQNRYNKEMAYRDNSLQVKLSNIRKIAASIFV